MSKWEFIGWGTFSVFLAITIVLLIINLMSSYTTWLGTREASKWRLLSWKTLSIFLTIILIPFLINLISNYTTWLGTRGHVEITFRLDGWATIGTLLESDLENLKLMYGSEPVENVLKVSWQVVNTGSTGISEFETPPLIIYPKGSDIAEARISQTSPLLKIGKNVLVNPGDGTIGISNIGVLNPGDYFIIDVYVINASCSLISTDYFNDWRLVAKSVDLKLKRDLTCGSKTHEERYGRKMLSSD